MNQAQKEKSGSDDLTLFFKVLIYSQKGPNCFGDRVFKISNISFFLKEYVNVGTIIVESGPKIFFNA